MHTFRLKVTPPKYPFGLDIQSPMLSVGSCFSEHIGNKFLKSHFNIVINPYGQQYNPVSISDGLIRLSENRLYRADDLFRYNEQVHSFDHHGSFSNTDESITLHLINEAFQKAVVQLHKAEYIWITPGTAHVFIHKDSQRLVNNCHKIPGKEYFQRLLTSQEILTSLSKAINEVRSINPKVKIIFTVSPVRYLASGAFENSIAKGRLFDAIYSLIQTINDVYYFPSYEIIVDELRDYRFYKPDMLHPSAEAIEYVWSKLKECMRDKTITIIEEVEAVNELLQHRLITNNKAEQQKYYIKLREKMEALAQKHNINFDAELTDVKQRLTFLNN